MNSEAPGRHKQSSYIDWTANILANGLHALPTVIRGHVVAVLGEFVGTTLFLFFAFAGTQVANVSSNTNTGTTVITTTAQKTPQQLLYISLSFGFSLAVNAWVFFRISGGLFNPAVTVGMWMIGAINFTRAVLLFITQLVGAIVAAFIVQALFTGGLNVSTSLSATTTIAQGVIIEMILTLQLVFTIFMLAAEKHTGNFIAPVGIGLSLFIAELVGVFWTGGSLNPARTFGPAVAIHSFQSEHWVYWVGPLAGTVLAVLLYKLIKALEYETLAPAAGEDTQAEYGPAPPAHGTVKDDGHPNTTSRSTTSINDVEKGADYDDGVNRLMPQDPATTIRPGMGNGTTGTSTIRGTSYRTLNRPLFHSDVGSSYRGRPVVMNRSPNISYGGQPQGQQIIDSRGRDGMIPAERGVHIDHRISAVDHATQGRM